MASLSAGNAAAPLHGLPPLFPPPDHPDYASNRIDEAPDQRRRRQQQRHHIAAFSYFPNHALLLRSMPPLGPPPGRAQGEQQQQQQQQQPPFPFPRLEKPSHTGVPLPLPSDEVASYGCPAPPRHFYSSGYRDDDRHAGQRTTPLLFPSQAATLLGDHTHLCHGDPEALHHSCPLGRQVGCAGEAMEGWDLRRSQHPVGVPSLQSGGGGGGGGGRRNAVSGWMRCGATTKTPWSREEHDILERGMNEYVRQTKPSQYAQISLDLRGGKTIRDVALRCKYYTDAIGDGSLNGLAQLDAEWEHATQSDGFREIDDTKMQLFEQNDAVFNQIIQNQMSSKTHDIINLFNIAYNNIQKLHNTLDNEISEDVSKYMKKLKPLDSVVQLLKPPTRF